MSDQQHDNNHQDHQDADSKADAIAALCLVLIAAATAIYFVSGA